MYSICNFLWLILLVFAESFGSFSRNGGFLRASVYNVLARVLFWARIVKGNPVSLFTVLVFVFKH